MLLNHNLRFNYGPKCNLSLSFYKLVNEIWSHARGFPVELKETMVVPQSPGSTERKSMSYALICPQGRGQVNKLSDLIWKEGRHTFKMQKNKNNLIDAQKYKLTSRVSSENVIEQSISCKLSNILRWIVLVQSLQLSLALVELLMVSLKAKQH